MPSQVVLAKRKCICDIGVLLTWEATLFKYAVGIVISGRQRYADHQQYSLNNSVYGLTRGTRHVERERSRGSPGVTTARKMVGLLAPRLPPPKQRLAHDVLANKDMLGNVGRS